MTTEDKIAEQPKNVIEQFAPYPRREEDATADAVYRHLLVSAIVTHFAKQQIRVPKPGEPGRVEALGESVSMSDLFVTEWTALVLFRRLRGLPMEDRDEHLPVTDEAALDLWLGWEDGELAPDLWEWAAEAGLDPDAIGDAFRASLAEEGSHGH